LPDCRPCAAGVSSSASIEVASMMALLATYNKEVLWQCLIA
jgi:galactokinase